MLFIVNAVVNGWPKGCSFQRGQSSCAWSSIGWHTNSTSTVDTCKCLSWFKVNISTAEQIFFWNSYTQKSWKNTVWNESKNYGVAWIYWEETEHRNHKNPTHHLHRIRLLPLQQLPVGRREIRVLSVGGVQGGGGAGQDKRVLNMRKNAVHRQ